MPSPAPSESRTGLVFGLSAYAFWGLAPLFWRLLLGKPAVELLAHRVAWGLLFFALAMALRGQLREFWAVRTQPKLIVRLAGSALTLSVNWFLFVYGVLIDRVLDVSLGYFINPLVSVALGRLVLGERLRPMQGIAVGIAAIGIGIAAITAGGLPWISLGVAASFGLYGLQRKTTQVSPLVGSTTEAMLVSPIAIGYLVLLASQGTATLGSQGWATDALLLATGPVTAVPLILFVNAARRLQLTTLGFLQYVAPTLQFVLGFVVFDEPLDAGRVTAFAVVWIALVVFSVDRLAARADRSNLPAK